MTCWRNAAIRERPSVKMVSYKLVLNRAGLGLCLWISYPKPPFMLVTSDAMSFLKDLCGVDPFPSVVELVTGNWFSSLTSVALWLSLELLMLSISEPIFTWYKSLTAPHLDPLSQEWLVIHLSNAENHWWQEHYHGWTIADYTSFHHFKVKLSLSCKLLHFCISIHV